VRTYTLSEQLDTEADTLIYADPSRSSRLRHYACIARKMEGAADDIVAGAQDEALEAAEREARKSWPAMARRREITVHLGQREQLPTEQWADNSALGGD
jgi:hypothetical protein